MSKEINAETSTSKTKTTRLSEVNQETDEFKFASPTGKALPESVKTIIDSKKEDEEEEETSFDIAFDRFMSGAFVFIMAGIVGLFGGLSFTFSKVSVEYSHVLGTAEMWVTVIIAVGTAAITIVAAYETHRTYPELVNRSLTGYFVKTFLLTGTLIGTAFVGTDMVGTSIEESIQQGIENNAQWQRSKQKWEESKQTVRNEAQAKEERIERASMNQKFTPLGNSNYLISADGNILMDRTTGEKQMKPTDMNFLFEDRRGDQYMVEGKTLVKVEKMKVKMRSKVTDAQKYGPNSGNGYPLAKAY